MDENDTEDVQALIQDYFTDPALDETMDGSGEAAESEDESADEGHATNTNSECTHVVSRKTTQSVMDRVSDIDNNGF